MKENTAKIVKEILTSVDETFKSQEINTVYQEAEDSDSLDTLYIQVPSVGPDSDEVMLELGFVAPSGEGNTMYLSVCAYFSEELDPIDLGGLLTALTALNALLPVGKVIFVNNSLFFRTEEGFSEELTKEEIHRLLELNLAYTVNTVNAYTSSLLRVSKGIESVETFLGAL